MMSWKTMFNNAPLREILREIEQISDYLWQRGWAERNAGNISIRITGLSDDFLHTGKGFSHFPLPLTLENMRGEILLLTGTGCRMRDIRERPPENLLVIRINEDGKNYQVISHTKDALGNLRPTSELASHLLIHQYLKEHKPDKKAVIHSHPTEVIAVTHLPFAREEQQLNRLIWSMHPEAVLFLPDGVGIVPYTLTGSSELGQRTLAALQFHDVAVWEKHGCLAVAESAGDAFDLIDLVNKSAGIYLKCRAAGYEAEGLSDLQIKELKARFNI